jgi:hypothetical protein
MIITTFAFLGNQCYDYFCALQQCCSWSKNGNIFHFFKKIQKLLNRFQDVSRGPTLVRTCYDIACSDNAVEFLNELVSRFPGPIQQSRVTTPALATQQVALYIFKQKYT